MEGDEADDDAVVYREPLAHQEENSPPHVVDLVVDKAEGTMPDGEGGKTADLEVEANNAFVDSLLYQHDGAWLQGVLVVTNQSLLFLDDGTGVIQLSLSADFLLSNWTSGMYVMVVGGYFLHPGDVPIIKVHKIVDLSAFHDQEAMWYLEVIEAYKLFYQPLMEDDEEIEN
ncbi:uncharacterized protein [Rutidosis leptorrhynchoides]|uniref:uncharacterized protein n=1 Tax=Rutidosis leptorrhynchoides TaxID=125765 RepID=UPI003A99AB98